VCVFGVSVVGVVVPLLVWISVDSNYHWRKTQNPHFFLVIPPHLFYSHFHSGPVSHQSVSVVALLTVKEAENTRPPQPSRVLMISPPQKITILNYDKGHCDHHRGGYKGDSALEPSRQLFNSRVSWSQFRLERGREGIRGAAYKWTSPDSVLFLLDSQRKKSFEWGKVSFTYPLWIPKYHSRIIFPMRYDSFHWISSHLNMLEE